MNKCEGCRTYIVNPNNCYIKRKLKVHCACHDCLIKGMCNKLCQAYVLSDEDYHETLRRMRDESVQRVQLSSS